MAAIRNVAPLAALALAFALGLGSCGSGTSLTTNTDTPKSGDKSVSSFSFTISQAQVSGTIDAAAFTIFVKVPVGTDVTALSPTILHTGARVVPPSGVAQDFTSPVVYTVTAADGTSRPYTVTVASSDPVDPNAPAIAQAFWGTWLAPGAEREWVFTQKAVYIDGGLSKHSAATATTVTMAGSPRSAGIEGGAATFSAGAATLVNDSLIRYEDPARSISGTLIPLYLFRASTPAQSGFRARLVDSSQGGTGRAGIAVKLIKADDPAESHEATTGTDGAFTVAGIALGAAYTLRVAAQAGVPAPVGATLRASYDGQDLGSVDIAAAGPRVSLQTSFFASSPDPMYSEAGFGLADGSTEYWVNMTPAVAGDADLGGASYAVSLGAGLSLGSNSGALSGSLGTIPRVINGGSTVASINLKIICAPIASEIEEKSLTVQIAGAGGRSYSSVVTLRFRRAPERSFSISLSYEKGGSGGILVDPDGQCQRLGATSRLPWKAGRYLLCLAGSGAQGSESKYGIGFDVKAPTDFGSLKSTSAGEPANNSYPSAGSAGSLDYGATTLQYLGAKDVDFFALDLLQGVARAVSDLEPKIYTGNQTVNLSADPIDASLYYTTDFSDPSDPANTSRILSGGGPISLGADQGLTVYAAKSGYHGTKRTIVDRSRLVRVPAGSFDMGYTVNYAQASTTMSLSEFYISNTELTVGQYRVYNNARVPAAYTDDQVMPNVSWFEALVYCNKRSLGEGLLPVYSLVGKSVTGATLSGSTNPDDWGETPYDISGSHGYTGTAWENPVVNEKANGYRIPTEAQWEYAARGGKPADSFTFAGSDNADEVAWTVGNSGGATHPAGQKLPNKLGLYDMSGNLAEWTWDWAAPIPQTPQTDYEGPASGAERVVRDGDAYGGWQTDYSVGRKDRNLTPGSQIPYIGLRVARARLVSLP